MKWRVLLVAAAVMLAGCGAGVLQPSADTTTSTPAETTTTTTAPTPTAAPTTVSTTTREPTTTTTTTAPPDNQWQKNPVTIAVEHYGDSDRNITPLVQDAIEYWNNNTTRYAGVNVTFELVSFTTEADIRLAYTPSLPRCGDVSSNLLGCADVVEPGTEPPRQADVRIVAGNDDRTTRNTIKHELGHVMGLGHDDQPQPLMNETAGYSATLPQPDARTLDLPWQNRTLDVYVDITTAGTGHESQVEHALQYFEDGADDTLAVTPTFRRVDAEGEADADIVIRVVGSWRDSELLGQDGSNGRVLGVDPDEDDALEYYTSARIAVGGIDNDATGWHVAYWLAYALGYEPDEYPPPLVDADYDDRRSQWWK